MRRDGDHLHMGILSQLFKQNANRIFGADASQDGEDVINSKTTMAKKAAASAAAKKVVKKGGAVSIKKVSAPKASKATKASAGRAERTLVCAEGGECFWLQDGRILSNLVDLRDAFDAMSDEAFMHHVTPERNDFSDWVEFVLRDERCAAALRKVSDRGDALRVTITHLKTYRI